MQTALFLCLAATVQAAGVWTQVATQGPHTYAGQMNLLSDGTVMAKTTFGGDSVGSVWDHLHPDATGSYANGTWTTEIPAMFDTRTDFSSQLLKDGRLYVAGGEYGTGGAAGEVYDPIANLWTRTPAPGAQVDDACSAILPDGKILQSLVSTGTRTVVWDPATNTYAKGPSALGGFPEAAWVKLPDESILQVDLNSQNSERYIPSQNKWIVDAKLPVNLFDTHSSETGAGFLLPNGKAFFLGAPGTTALYTPSGTASPGTWIAGPIIPNQQGTPDAPGAMMINGKVLCAVSPTPTATNSFPTPISFYEYDYLANAFTQVAAPGGGMTRNAGSYVANMLQLPNGQVLYSEQGIRRYYLYTPDGAPLASGKPGIKGVQHGGTDCRTGYTITGTLFNGISEGAAYGDDEQMNTNYPIIRLAAGSQVTYARTFHWNSTGVQRGQAADTAQFTLPSTLSTSATYSLVVTANGIESDPLPFTPCEAITVASRKPAGEVQPQDYSVQVVDGKVRIHWLRSEAAAGALIVRLTSLAGRILINETVSDAGSYDRTFDPGSQGKGILLLTLSGSHFNAMRRIAIP